MKIKQIRNTGAVVVALGLMLSAFVVAVVPRPAVAASCGGIETSTLDCGSSGSGVCPNGSVIPADRLDEETCPDGSRAVVTLQDTGIWGILLLAINILTAGVGVVAVAGIVYAAIMYTSAGGNAEQTKKAMGIIMNIVIGVIAYAGMFALLNFLVPGGLFQ